MDDTKKALLSIDIDTAALTQNAANAKAAVAALADQLKELKTAGKDSGEAFDKIVEQLKKAGEEAKKSNDSLKEYSKGLAESAKAAGELSAGNAELSKQHNNLQGNTAKSTKSVSDYTNSFLKAVESVTPFGKSISETAEKFKTFQEGATKVGKSLGLLKKDGEAAATNALNLSTNAGNATKGFEALTTGTQSATGGISTFTKALAGTGIGLVIIAVAALTDYLKQVTPLVDKVEQVTAGLTGGFNALGRIVMNLLSPLKNLFVDPKQAMIDFVNFMEQNVLNRFKAFGVLLDAIHNHSFKQFNDGLIQMGTGITNATDKVANFGKTIYQAGVDTGKLKGEQQELARTIESEALKAMETEAKVAELRVKAQSSNLAMRKAALKEIEQLEAKQAKLHKDNIENGLDLAIKDVSIKRALTLQEIDLIKTRGTAELDDLARAGRIYADDVKSLGEALGKKFDLRKADAEKTKALHSTSAADGKKHAQDKKKQDDETAKAKKAQDDFIKNQQLHDEKELYDLQQQAAIKAVENNFEQVFKIKQAQLQKDRQFELDQTNLTETQRKIINERYNQLDAELIRKHNEDKANAKREAKSREFAETLKQDQLEIDAAGKNSKLKLAAELKFLKDKHDAEIFAAGKDEELKKQIDLNYDKAVQKRTAEEKKTIEGEIKLINQKAQHYKQHFTQLAGLFAKNTEVGKAAFMAKKALAVADIAISTEQQVSASISATKNQIKHDSDVPFPLGTILVVKDIALGAIDVASTIANGVKQAASINSTNVQGFARGGLYRSDGYGAYLTGPGSGTSDSINAKLSNGESIINARSTQMFAPILSAINQAGGGRAFNNTNPGNGYAQGGLFNGSNTLNDGYSELANTRALNDMAKTMAANMPRQILVVEDVQASLQNKAMLQSMSNF